jgi:hypothetical protein
VFVALPADNEVKLPIFETVLNGITIQGSIVGTRNDLREVFELHAAGKTRVIREVRSLDQVNESIADVEAGRVAADRSRSDDLGRSSCGSWTAILLCGVAGSPPRCGFPPPDDRDTDVMAL